jgi:hypothetical protein
MKEDNAVGSLWVKSEQCRLSGRLRRQQNEENSQVKFAPLRALLLMDSTDRMIETSSGSGIRSGM